MSDLSTYATTEKPTLWVGEASVVRESDNTVEIPLPALRLTDLTATEADLVAAFVPVAVGEAGGFTGFRETATKTNSLVDRLRTLTLPRVADVGVGLESYVRTKERAEGLEAKIEETAALIDEIIQEAVGE